MTLSATSRLAALQGDDAQTSFPFAFKIFAESDIKVVVSSSAAAEQVLTLNVDYTVTLNENQETSPGGLITYPIEGTALPSGSTLSIIGDLPYDQPLDIPPGGNFSPIAFENELDRILMQIQQLVELIERALLGPVGVAADFNLPRPSVNSLIGWNSLASGLINYPVSDLATAIGYGEVYLKTFTGTGTQTSFTLDEAPVTLGNCDVSVDGMTLVPGVDFSLSNTTLLFASAPANGSEILVRYGRAITTSSPLETIIIACSDETSALTAGTSKVTFRMPYAMTLSAVRASLTTAQTSGSILTVDVNESGTSILSTKLTIDNTEKTSTTAAISPVISDGYLALDSEITVDIDQIGDGTAKGLKVTLVGVRS